MTFKPKPHTIPLQPQSIAIMGLKGTFAHVTCKALFESFQLDPCVTPLEAFNRVAAGQSEIAVIPVANTEAGPVPYVHQLIESRELHVIGEYHLPVIHNLLTLPGTDIADIKIVHSHPHALGQCSEFFEKHPHLTRKQSGDTATAAQLVAHGKDPSQASISSTLAAVIYSLEIKEQGIQNQGDNITRFLAFAREPIVYDQEDAEHFITTVVVKPYRALNYPILEIEMVLKNNGVVHSVFQEFNGSFFRNENYYMELVGHADSKKMKRTLEELRGISSDVRMMGCYPTHHFDIFPQRKRAENLAVAL